VRLLKAMKPVKDEISIDNKISANNLKDILLYFEKRLVINECKQKKYKKKVSKLMEDLYEPDVEPNVESNVNEEVDMKSNRNQN
jgi:hypothetical protein